MPPQLPPFCPYCNAASSEFVLDDSSGQWTCTSCGSQLGGFRIDFSRTGESCMYNEEGQADATERVSAPADPLWEGLDGDDVAVARLRGERSEGFGVIEKAASNLGLGVACMQLAKVHFKNIHMRKTLCATYKPSDADADADTAGAQHALFQAQAKELGHLTVVQQAAACVYIAARCDGQGQIMSYMLGAFKEWNLAQKQLNAAIRVIPRILEVDLPALTANSTIAQWAQRLQLPAPVARAAAEIAENCARIAVPHNLVEIVNFARSEELLAQGYSIVKEVLPSQSAAGSASQVMFKMEKQVMHSLADGKIATTASGALYCAAYVCGDVGRPNFRTMKQISDVTSAAWKTTIPKQVKEMAPHLEQLLPPMYGNPVLIRQLAEHGGRPEADSGTSAPTKRARGGR